MAKRKNKSANASKTPAVVRPKEEPWGIGRHIAWWSILTMLFVTPLAISNLSFLGVSMPISYDQFDIIKVFVQRVFGLIALAGWSWDILLKGGKIRRTPVDWLILAFLAWVAVSAIFSIHPPTAFFGKYRRFEGWISFLNYAVIYFITLQLADRPKRIKRLAQTLFWSGMLVASYGILQAMGKDILKWGQLPFEVNRSFSTYGNPDLLAGFLMFGVFVSLGLALSESNLVWRGVYWLGVLMNTLVVVTAFARSAWVGSVAGFAFILLFALRQKVSWKFEDWAFAGVAGSGVLAFIVRSLSAENEVMNFAKRVKSIFQFDQGSAKTRFEIWDAALSATMDRPIFGFGPDTFRLIFPRYKPVEYVKDAGYLSVADNVHNYPLQLAAGIGVPGLVMFYSIAGWAAARSFKVIWSREQGQQERMVLAGFWAACAGYIVHLFFGLSVTGTSFLFWLSMAAVLSPTATSIEVPKPKQGAVVPIVVAALVLALAAAGVAYQFVYMRADNAYLMARIGAQGGDRTTWAKKAVQLNPFNDMYRAEVGLALTDEALQAVNAVNSAQGADQQAAYTAALEAFKRAEESLKETIEFVPWEYDNYVFLANLYNLGGQFFDPGYYQKAIEIGEEGIRVEPFGPAIRLQYARALLGVNREDDAIKQLEEAVRMDPAYTDANSLLSTIYENRGDVANQLRILRAAEAWSPGQAGISDKLKSLESSLATTP